MYRTNYPQSEAHLAQPSIPITKNKERISYSCGRGEHQKWRALKVSCFTVCVPVSPFRSDPVGCQTRPCSAPIHAAPPFTVRAPPFFPLRSSLLLCVLHWPLPFLFSLFVFVVLFLNEKMSDLEEKKLKDLIYYILLFFVLFVPRERIELPSLRLQFSALPLSYPGYISPFIFFSFLVVLIYSFFF